jgi:hypothetical protein
MTADVLSEVLSAVRLTGAVFFDVTAASPWVAEAPPSAEIVDAIMPGAQHAIEYHVVTRGSCWISLVGGAPFKPVQLREGDIAVIPHGEPHAVSSAPGMRAEPNLDLHRRSNDDSGLPFKLKTGSDGVTDSHLICGFSPVMYGHSTHSWMHSRASCASAAVRHQQRIVCWNNLFG